MQCFRTINLFSCSSATCPRFVPCFVAQACHCLHVFAGTPSVSALSLGSAQGVNFPDNELSSMLTNAYNSPNLPIHSVSSLILPPQTLSPECRPHRLHCRTAAALEIGVKLQSKSPPICLCILSSLQVRRTDHLSLVGLRGQRRVREMSRVWLRNIRVSGGSRRPRHQQAR